MATGAGSDGLSLDAVLLEGLATLVLSFVPASDAFGFARCSRALHDTTVRALRFLTHLDIQVRCETRAR